MRLAVALGAAAAALAACAQPPPPTAQVLTREVLITRNAPAPMPTAAPAAAPAAVAVPRTPCASLVRPAPAYPDRDAALRAAPGVFEQVQLLLAARQARIARERELEQALRRCVVEPRGD